MQISSASTSGSGMALQALRDLFQTSSTDQTGQKTPTDRPKGPPPGPPPSGPPPSDMAGGGFSSDTLSSLLGVQEDGGDAVSTLLSDLDGDASGDLSLDEIGAALGQTDTASLTDVFASLDTDGDSQLTSTELSTALQSMLVRQAEAYGRQTPTGLATSIAA